MGFAPVQYSSAVIGSPVSTLIRNTQLQASPIDLIDVAIQNNNIGDMSVMNVDNAVSMLASSSSMVISETEAWVQPLSLVLGPFLNFFSFAMVSDYMRGVLLFISFDIVYLH